MTPGLLGIAAGFIAVVEFTNRFFREANVTEKQGFKWVRVTISPAVWQYTDGDAVRAQVVQNGPVWRWESNDSHSETRCWGVCKTLEAAHAAALEVVE
jgi:hypothetical protein